MPLAQKWCLVPIIGINGRTSIQATLRTPPQLLEGGAATFQAASTGPTRRGLWEV